MKRPMQTNSLNAWRKTILPTLKTRKEQIIVVINEFTTDRGLTMREVAEILMVPLHTISGRFGELIKDNKLAIDGVRKFDGVDQEHSIYKSI